MADLRGSTADSGDDATRIRPKEETVILPGSVGSPGPVRQPAQDGVQPDPATEKGGGAPLPADGVPPKPVAGVVRHGPGVPAASAGQGGRTAEHIWGGRTPPNRSARWRRLGGWAFTAVLLVASGAVLFARFHHVSFRVTSAMVSAEKASGCRVDVTGLVKTNGAAGTITYRWQFSPGGEQASTTLHQSVSHGQHAADLVITLEVAGHGGTTQAVVLQILDPDPRAVSVPVTLTC